jgi:hypothetical protein
MYSRLQVSILLSQCPSGKQTKLSSVLFSLYPISHIYSLRAPTSFKFPKIIPCRINVLKEHSVKGNQYIKIKLVVLCSKYNNHNIIYISDIMPIQVKMVGALIKVKITLNFAIIVFDFHTYIYAKIIDNPKNSKQISFGTPR